VTVVLLEGFLNKSCVGGTGLGGVGEGGGKSGSKGSTLARP
jgi:hypothetical protein